MLKPGKFLHIRLSEVESEGSFDTYASVYCSCHSQIYGGVWDIFLGGGNPPLTALE